MLSETPLEATLNTPPQSKAETQMILQQNAENIWTYGEGSIGDGETQWGASQFVLISYHLGDQIRMRCRGTSNTQEMKNAYKCSV